MTDRYALIARKESVRRQIEQARRELARLRAPEIVRPNRRRINQLEDRLERLMAEEYNLRLAIDRARK